MKILSDILDTPWKIFNELKMFVLKPFVCVYLKNINDVKFEKFCKFYGFPKIFKHRKSKIEIGKNFENRNTWFSNPLGINHPTIFCTWEKDAKIKIGNDVGISGGSIVASKSIEIGDGTLIGTNCTIIDTDFHPAKSEKRRYDKKNIKSAPIKIGKNVFIGMNAIILKGVTVSDNSVIPAGAVIRKSL
jgi:acetyltransferase-like isoleucine patch superfamily enzyme